MTQITASINLMAQSHTIGQLQAFRKVEKGLKIPAAGGKIFSAQSTSSDYAFHSGGREELQFNVGLKPLFRYGVAFSLEPSRSLPDIAPLVPKIFKFNEYLKSNPDEFGDLEMLYWIGDKIESVSPGPIAPKFVTAGMFIFLGRLLQDSAQIDHEAVLQLFDRLFPLYKFVEGRNTTPPNSRVAKRSDFKPGCELKPSTTTATLVERTLDIKLRHNDIQYALHNHLAGIYGEDNVGIEGTSGTGNVDVVVRQQGKFWFYEIKSSCSARVCMRQGLAQLMEYSFWPGAQEPEHLIIVGEHPLDAETKSYLETLQTRFHMPIRYQQFDLAAGKFI